MLVFSSTFSNVSQAFHLSNFNNVSQAFHLSYFNNLSQKIFLRPLIKSYFLFHFNYLAKFSFKDLNFFLQQFFKVCQSIYTSFCLFYISKWYKFLGFKIILLPSGKTQVTEFFFWHSIKTILLRSCLF